MADKENAATCRAAANLLGEHVPCDEAYPHDGWAHGNRQHGLIWCGSDVAAPVGAQQDGNQP